MKKISFTVLFFGLLFLGMTVFAVGGKESAPVQSDDPSKYTVTEPITIEWWHALEAQYAEVIKKIVDNFNSSQKLITVQAKYIGNYTTLNETLVAAHAAGKGLPALSAANTPYVAEYAAGRLSEPLDGYIAATKYDVKDFGIGLINATTYQGKITAFPFLISTQIMYYNKNMAKERKITMPIKWSEMDSFMKAATVFNPDGTTKVYATVFAGWDQWYFETLYLNRGVNIVNKDGETTDLDSPTAIEIAQKIKEWCDKGYTYWASGTAGSSTMRQNFVEGKTFSVMHTSSLYNTYVSLCKNFEVGMAWYPGDKTKKSEIGGSILVIPAKNDQKTKNAAWQFLSYLCGPQVNMTWAIETGYMPTRKSVLETSQATEFLKQKPEFKVIFDNLDQINPRIQHVAWSQLSTIWMAYMAETINENKNVSMQMKAMAHEINEVLGDK